MRKSADLCDRKRLFEQFDLDGDGKLTRDELEKALRACLPSVTSDEVDVAMRTLSLVLHLTIALMSPTPNTKQKH